MSLAKRLSFLPAALAFVVVLLAAGAAHAQPAILKPGTRPMFFTGGVGAEWFGLNDGDFDRGGGLGADSRFKVGLDFGYHFSGKSDGPAIGASIEQTFGGYFDYMFNPSFKFWWDIEIADMAVYITPFAKAGYALMTEHDFCGRGFGRFSRFGCDDLGHFFNLGFGVEGRVILNDRGLLFFRLVQIDTYLGDEDWYGSVIIVSYTAMIGGGVTF